MSIGNVNQIASNLQAQQSLNDLNNTNENLANIQEQLSTGSRINQAADDVAGFSIANNLEARIRGQAQAQRNVGDAQSLLNVAEGSLDSVNEQLQQMQELSVQAANDSLGAEERGFIQSELEALSEEIDQTLEETTFNGEALFEGQDLTFQVNASEGDTFEVGIDELDASELGVSAAAEDIATETIENTIVSDVDTDGADSIDNSDIESFAGDATISPDGGDVDEIADVDLEIAIDGQDSDTTADEISIEGDITFINADGNVEEGEIDATISGDPDADLATESLEITNFAGTNTDLQINDLDNEALDGNTDLESGDTASFDLSGTGDNPLDVSTSERAGETITTVENALDQVVDQISTFGDAQNRLDFKAENLETAEINNEAARSQIEDADFADLQVQQAQQQIIQQTGTAALAQANAAPEGVLQLLG